MTKLMAEIQLGGIHSGLNGTSHHIFNIGELSGSQRKELIQRYNDTHGAGTLIIMPSIRPNESPPDFKTPSKFDGMINAEYLYFQQEVEKEVIELVEEIKNEFLAKGSHT